MTQRGYRRAPSRRAVLRRLGLFAAAGAAGCGRDGAAAKTEGVATIPKPAVAAGAGAPPPGGAPPKPTPPAAPTQRPAIHEGGAGTAPIFRGTLLATDEAVDRAGRSQTLLTCIDLDAEVLSARSFAVPFYGHGYAIDPRDAGRCLIFEKKGPGCCLVNLRLGQVVAQVAPRPGRQFYGHGTFNRDGAYLFCTETFVEDGSLRGVIAVRDSNTLTWKADLPSFGASPHDLHLAPDQRHLVVTNGGGTLASGSAPSLCWIDLRSHRTVRQLALSDAAVNAGHVALLGDDRAVVVSAPRDGLALGAADVHGGIAFWRGEASVGARLESAHGPEVAAMAGETLSVAIHRGSRAAVATNPRGHQVSRWDIDSAAPLQATSVFREPRGVAFSLDGSELALTCGEGSALLLLDPLTLQPRPGRTIPDCFSGGAHLHVVALDHVRGSGRRRA